MARRELAASPSRGPVPPAPRRGRAPEHRPGPSRGRGPPSGTRRAAADAPAGPRPAW
jgi:hypothetical protein